MASALRAEAASHFISTVCDARVLGKFSLNLYRSRGKDGIGCAIASRHVSVGWPFAGFERVFIELDRGATYDEFFVLNMVSSKISINSSNVPYFLALSFPQEKVETG